MIWKRCLIATRGQGYGWRNIWRPTPLLDVIDPGPTSSWESSWRVVPIMSGDKLSPKRHSSTDHRRSSAALGEALPCRCQMARRCCGSDIFLQIRRGYVRRFRSSFAPGGACMLAGILHRLEQGCRSGLGAVLGPWQRPSRNRQAGLAHLGLLNEPRNPG